MKQEDKDLLLKDLCSRLPYGVKCQIKGEELLELVILKSFMNCEPIFAFDFYLEENSSLDFKELGEFKPYLFPLSSMTIKQKVELANLTCETSSLFETAIIEIEFYNKHHIDYRGLIPKGLAIDCTNSNI